MYHWQHENCWMAVRKGHGSHWRGSRTQSTLWSVPSLNPFGRRNAEEMPTGHSAQKPVELMRRPILNHLESGEIVYDAFLGSGTTLIAAEMNERICYGLEIEPKYVASSYVDGKITRAGPRRWRAMAGASMKSKRSACSSLSTPAAILTYLQKFSIRESKQMPRPKFIPTDLHRATVKSLAAYGIRQEEIATMIGLRSPKTLRRHFREELLRGSIEATAQVSQTLYQMATSGEEPACTIFWMKTRAGWREKQNSENGPSAVPDFVVVEDKEDK